MKRNPTNFDPIQVEVFKNLFSAIAEEMGVVLRKSSFSPNIKERRDFSCALFDREGRLIAQAAHIPVHLGSMPLSVAAAIQRFPNLVPGDMILLNDPFEGGTHLPDLTLVSPVFLSSSLFSFVASRAHHADVGGIAPGSMPIAREIYQEGLIIPPVKLFEAGNLNQSVLDLILANVRTPGEREGDIWAQVAANQRGEARLLEMTKRYSPATVTYLMGELLAYTERMTRRLLQELPDGFYRFTDYLDDDGIGDDPANFRLANEVVPFENGKVSDRSLPQDIPISVIVQIDGDRAIVDFHGSAPQQKGSVNAVYAITLSAVFYVFQCLVGKDVPNNFGSIAPIEVIVPERSIVNAHSPAPVAGGNVETSQRIVDVLLGALSQALPDVIPAASQGTMNNITIGGRDERQPGASAFAYYETIGGGMGATWNADGVSAVHSHMTNTLNTPVEALEFAYPLQVVRYEIRRGSGGAGKYKGGDGIRRDIRLLNDAQVNLLCERRRLAPYGLNGGLAGKPGENVLIREGKEYPLPGKGMFSLKTGDILSIRTPGGGGFGTDLSSADK